MILFFYLLIALLWDLFQYRIPNWWIVAGYFLGLLEFVLAGNMTVLDLGQGVLVTSVLLILFFLKVLGGGDIKVFYVAALFLGSETWRLILLSFLLNGLYALLKMLFQRDLTFRLYHFYAYVIQCFYQGKASPYQSLESSKKDQVHFMVGIFFGYILFTKWRFFI
ncbi:MAG: prepilin peptidase [Anaerostipes sp.]|nr:prepilin peptidase [Anaerostipes sp.]